MIVENPQYAGMPSSAVATGLVDLILPPAAIPQKLVEYVSAPNSFKHPGQPGAHDVPAEPMQQIFALLRNQTGHDFSSYKKNTIYRRIARRMNLHQIDDYDQYVRYLSHNPEEIDHLFQELLISVTNFFRDPDAWEALTPCIQQLIESTPEGGTLRAWVPGCSSGEEVFSLAILLQECVQDSNRRLNVQVFGTDLDARAIDRARTGRYPEGIADDLTPQRLKTYFVKEDGHYRICKQIRESTIFSVQNAIKDPPFTRMNIISCRNMLIYLNAEIQKKLLPIFHYALQTQGLLFLGSSETVGTFTDLFEPVEKRWKIFQRPEVVSRARTLPEFPVQSLTFTTGGERYSSIHQKDSIKKNSVSRIIERALLGRFAPPCAVVNSRGDIIYVHCRTGAYLEPNEGQPRNNILEMAREGLQLELAEAIKECLSQETDIVRRGIRVKGNGESAPIDLALVHLHHPEVLRELLLVAFCPVSSMSSAAPPDTSEQPASMGTEENVAQLERALRFMQETHQATLEDLETSNEELEATNEELQSTNEELQSSNEELETSKEEMQSLNEEPTTVNAELLSKVEDLSQANDDMQNFLNSTKIATIFLDNSLNIKRYTEQAKDLVSLRPSDVGRPISELASKLQHEDLAENCANVLKTLVFREEEVKTQEGEHYIMRIMPYRTADNAIDGLVLTFVDINRLKSTQKELRQMAEVFQEGAEPIIIIDLEERVVDLNTSAVEAYGYARDEIVGTHIQTIVPPAQHESIGALLARCRDGEKVRNEPWTLLSRTGTDIAVSLTLTILTSEQGGIEGIALVTRQSKD